MDKKIDRVFELAMGVMEYALALAFVFAVVLNFVNVVGRYGMGYSILGSDEVQIYIMVFMTFLGAAVITWRKQHLRMDVLVQFFPEWLKTLLKGIEILLFLLLSGFVLVTSSRYAGQMLILDRKSDNAGIPMWIPHGAVAVGFGLMALILLWHGIKFARGERRSQGGAPSAGEEAKP
jgi:TRAP-type transport system small permease protein